jgi:hypothetical protein
MMKFSLHCGDSLFAVTEVVKRCDVMKMADCETTNGHVGRTARTLMKDARRDLDR